MSIIDEERKNAIGEEKRKKFLSNIYFHGNNVSKKAMIDSVVSNRVWFDMKCFVKISTSCVISFARVFKLKYGQWHSPKFGKPIK